jgi:hypothetical protein
MYERTTHRAVRPSNYPDDVTPAPGQCQQIPEGRTSIDLLTYRQENALSLWTGEPLIGEHARQWLRTRLGRPEYDGGHLDVIKIMRVTTTTVEVLRAGGLLGRVDIPEYRIER